MTFKYLLLLILSGSFIYIFMLPRRKVYRRTVLIAGLGVMFLFALRPDWSTAVAQALGVGRGADLLFYIAHLAFAYIAFAYYLKFKDLESQMTRVVRTLALDKVQCNPRPIPDGAK